MNIVFLKKAGSMYTVNTNKLEKDVRINIKVNRKLREEFQIACDLRGATMSTLLHQYIVKTIREEKEQEPAAFAGSIPAKPAPKKVLSREKHTEKKSSAKIRRTS